MENNFDFQETLRASLAGELTPEAQAAFEALLRQSPEAMEEYRFSLQLSKALRHRDVLTAAAVAQRVVGEEGFPPPPAPASGGTSAIRVLAVAGVALTLVLAGWLGYTQGRERGWWGQPAAVRMAQPFVKPLENVLALPDDPARLPDLQAGMDAYNSGNYALAAERLTAYCTQNAEASACLYAGTAHLLAGNPRTAVRLLEPLRASNEPPVRETALWYLALAYFQNNQPDEARRVLNDLPPGNLYENEVKRLLEQ